MSPSSSSTSNSTVSTTSKTGFLKREEILGKPVVGQDAMIVGTVKDLAVAVDGKVALQIERKKSDPNSDTPDVFVGSDEILAVGDFVLLRIPKTVSSQESNSKKEISSAPLYPGNTQSRICPRCQYANNQAARFCVRCGSML